MSETSPSLLNILMEKSPINSENVSTVIWGLLIISIVVYYLYTKYVTYSKSLNAYSPDRLSILDDKLKQKRLLQQQAWQAQASLIYEEEKKQSEQKKREKQAQIYEKKENKSDSDSDNEELRAMLTKDPKAKSGFKPNWLDSNYNSGSNSGPRMGRIPGKPAGNCGPSS